jgi:hypothetical protein
MGGAGEMTALRPDITALPDLMHGHSRSGPVSERLGRVLEDVRDGSDGIPKRRYWID